MLEALANLGLIAAFFALDVIYRQVLVRESGYFALDLSLFALLESGYTLVTEARADHNIEVLDLTKPLAALIFYTCLVILYANLQRKQMRRLETAFATFHEFLAERQEAETAKASGEAEALMRHHKDQRRQVDAVRQMAEETIWINVFLKKPRPRKLERAEDLVDLLSLVVTETHVPPGQQLKPADLYLKRSWPTALAAVAATILTCTAAVVPI